MKGYVRKSSGDEVLFELNFIPKKEDLQEFNSRILFRNYEFFCYALALIMTVVYAFYSTLGLALTFMVIAIVIVNIAKSLRLKQLVKQFQMIAKTNPKIQWKVFYADKFETYNGIFGYEQISKIIVADLCQYIIIENVATVMLKKDAFTIGDYDSFIVFLREKLKDNPKALKGLR